MGHTQWKHHQLHKDILALKVLKVKSLGRFWCGCVCEWNNGEGADSRAGLVLIELSSDRVKSPPSANLHIL